jgi:serine/threonine protein kinase
LLTKLLQFDPSKRITSLEALNHPYFTNNNGIISPIMTPASVSTTTFFDLPIIPLSPFQLEEEYSQFNLLQRKSSIANSSVYNQPFADTNLLETNPLQEDNCSTLTRTNSFPNLYNMHCELDTRQIYPHHHYHRHIEHGNTLQRSVSDLSLSFSNNSNDIHHTSSQDQKQQQQPQQQQQEKQKVKLKPINRFHFWTKKRITT